MISADDFADKARKRIQESKQFLNKSYQDMRDSFAFVSGDQWTDQDRALLEEQQRPPITFNYSEKMIDAVCGAEVSNRQEVRYVPREVTDGPLSDLWTEASRWVRDECLAEDEETDAFRDCLICGIGATRTAMDYEEDADGKIVINRRDPINLAWDPAARKPGLTDRRYDIERGWMDRDEARQRWPKVDYFATGSDQEVGFSGVIRTGNRYNEDIDTQADIHKDQVEITHYECVEKEPYYRIADGDNILEMDEKEFAPLRKQMDTYGIKYVRLLKKVYYRAFMTGDTVLEWGKSPCQHGFTLNFMTGKRDRNRNVWYGLTRVMKDPQRWANKWLSQILHIINSNAKGGLLAEVNAFVDPRKAQEEWSSPDSITLLTEGSLSGNKVKEKGMAQYPSGLDKLMDFALNSLPMVTGINLEALGLANREQANVLEQSRKQAAYGLLAPVFDGLRRYRKVQGKVLLYFITEYISDGRLIRIVGNDQAQFVPLTKMPDAITYDIVIDQSPNAPDVKQRTWEQLMQIVPVMMKEGLPVPPDLLDYSPLPATMVQKWKAFIQQTGGMGPQQIQAMQQQMQQLQMENQQLKQDQSVKMGELQQKGQIAAQEQELNRQVAEAELALEQFKINAEMQLEQIKLNAELSLNQQKAENDAKMSDAKMRGDLKIKAASAAMDGKDITDLSFKLDSNDLAKSIEAIAESNATLADAVRQANETQVRALQELEGAMNRPKVIVRDEQGRPIGVKPASNVRG